MRLDLAVICGGCGGIMRKLFAWWINLEMWWMLWQYCGTFGVPSTTIHHSVVSDLLIHHALGKPCARWILAADVSRALSSPVVGVVDVLRKHPSEAPYGDFLKTATTSTTTHHHGERAVGCDRDIRVGVCADVTVGKVCAPGVGV